MPKVSILLPAFRPQYLDACIASALAQTFRDFELLIGDDSPGSDIERVVEKWTDPRIRYSRNPNRGTPASNRDMLLGQASGDYIKFLFDDDLLLPQSVATLCAAADATGATLAFHANYVIDSIGRSRAEPTIIPDGAAATMTREQLFDIAISGSVNFIGGPVNILIERKTLEAIPNPFGLGIDRMRFLTDMALYTNFADRGHGIVGLGNRLSAFRVHDQQTSSQTSPIHSAGLFEWEYLTRWTADRWQRDRHRCSTILETLHRGFRERLGQHPQLRMFIELGSQPDDSGSFFTPAFRTVLEHCWAIVDQAGSLVATASP
jgi:glycosyltransferase involved in cell wall biosynthesis